MSFFDPLELLPEDPILSIPKFFMADPRPYKVNLGVGSYKDAEGASYVLECIKDAETDLALKKITKDYLPIEGDRQFLKLVEALIFGSPLLETFSGRIASVQTIGGTGALFLGGQFLSQSFSKTIYLPNATWSNHRLVCSKSGFQVNQYRYYDEKSHQLDFSNMCLDISKMPSGSTILLQPCCHNPTGIDPTEDQWKELSAIIKKKGLIPFFDFAYQGFKKSVDEDAFSVRYFVSQGHELLVANSFAKNFGLYSERIGTFSIMTENKENIPKIESHLKQLIRGNYSSPPRHGAEIIKHILSTEKLKKVWIIELANMRDRLKEMRHTLATDLQAKSRHLDWSFLNHQNGFFSFCGFNQIQVNRLIKDFAIYMPSNGRINVSGLNGHNMDYVIEAILAVKST